MKKYLLASLGLVALSGPAQAQKGMLEPANRSVDLDPKENVATVHVQGAPYVLTALVFPEEYTQVSCGNCTEQEGQVAENWHLTRAVAEKTVYVKPTKLPGPGNPPTAFTTTIHVTLASGYRVNVVLKLVDLAGSEPPDAEVAFKLPEAQMLAGKLAQQDKEREEKFKNDVQEAATRMMLKNVLGELRCKDAWGKPFRTKRMVVRLRQACQVEGVSKTIWAVFEVENRGAQLLELDTASLVDDGEQSVAVDEEGLYLFEKQKLRFDEKARGVVLVSVAADQDLPKKWKLSVFEKGGDRREVVVDDIEL